MAHHGAGHRLAALGAVLLVGGALSATTGRAQAVTVGSCTTSHSYTWTGNGEGGDWGDADNWTEQHVPKDSDSAVLTGTEADQISVDSGVPTSICNLTIGDNTFLTPGPGGITVGGTLDWSSDAERSGIFGDITVGGTATLSSTKPDDAYLELDSSDGTAPATMTVDGTAILAPNTNLELGSGPTDSVVVNGALHVGKGSYLWSNSAGGDYGSASAALDIHGTVVIDGDAHSDWLDWNLDPLPGLTPTIDLAGHTLTLDTAGNTRWKDGGEVTSSAGPGVIDDRGDLLMLDGTTTLDENVTFKLDDSGDYNRASLSDGDYYEHDGGPTGAAGGFAGSGTVDLGVGTLYGTLTLGQGITTNISTPANGDDDTEISDTYGPGSVLINRGALHLLSGTLDGQANTTPEVQNYGTLDVSTGVTVSDVTWVDEPGTTLSVAAGSGVPATTPATFERVTMSNRQAATSIAPDAVLSIENSDDTLAGAELTGGGTYRTTDSTSLSLAGTVTVAASTTLQLGDATRDSFVLAGHESTPATLTGGPGGGRLAYVESEIEGQLEVAKTITTTLTPSAGYHEIESGNGFDQGLLALAGPTSIANTTLDVDSGSRLDIGGRLSVTGGTADTPAGVTGQGTVTTTGHVTLGAHGAFQADTITMNGGTIDGTGTLEATVVNKHGTVAPGTSARAPGTMTVVGSYRQKSHGTLRLDVRSASRHDTLRVRGPVALDGILTVADLDKKHPHGHAHVHRALTVGSRSGTFHKVVSVRHPRHLTWHASYLTGKVDLALR